MDSIENARQAMIAAGKVGNAELSERLKYTANVWAAIAQAEQLKRIADSLDVIVHEWAKPHYIINNQSK